MVELSSLTFIQWGLAILCAVFVGMSKAGMGGLGTMVVLLMAMLFPARESTGIVLPMLIFADIFAVLIYRKHAVFSHVLRLLPPAFLGIIFGFWLMPKIPGHIFGTVIGWLTLILSTLFLIQKASGQLEKVAAAHPAIAWPTGLLAGTSTMLANAAGPIMVVYLLACKLPKFEFVGTGAIYFLILNVVKVPFSAGLGLITPSTLLFDVSLAPAILLGVGIGRYLTGRIPQKGFEYLMLIFSILASLKLIF